MDTKKLSIYTAPTQLLPQQEIVELPGGERTTDTSIGLSDVLSQIAPDRREQAKAELVALIIKTMGIPMDIKAVAATLESTGLRDVDAQTDLGADNLFALAEDIYRQARQRISGTRGEAQELKTKGVFHRIGRFFKYYFKGSLFAAPMVAQIAVLLALGSSLWLYLFYNERQASVIALGLMLSYIITGGFTQAMSRRGMLYWEQGIYHLAKRTSQNFLWMGIILVIFVSTIMYMCNLIQHFFEKEMILICILYFFLLSLLWLNLSTLLMMKQHLAILMTTLIGGVLVWALLTFVGSSIYISHTSGILASSIIAFFWGRLILAKKIHRMTGEQKITKMPRYSIITLSAGPYFFYGGLYFGFMFLDRFIGWSAPHMAGGELPPYIIWFRIPYEVGIDLALIFLVLTIPVLEYTINEFSTLIIPIQENLNALKVSLHNRSFKTFYAKQLFLLMTVALVNTCLVEWLRAVTGVVMGDDVIALFVFRWGIAGYSFMALGLLNVAFFNTLSRPLLAVKAISAGFLVNMIVGVVLSRNVAYYFSIIGLTAGAVVFGALSTVYAWRIMNELDYYYYSSY